MPLNELSITFVSAEGILASTISLSIMGMIVVSLRFWLRISHRMGLQADDWCILVSLVFLLSTAALALYGVSQKALGYPSEEYATIEEQYTSLPAGQRLVELISWISWLLLLPANGLVKLSTLFLYRRIFPVEAMPTFNIVSKFMVVICILWVFAFMFATVFSCGIHFGCAWGSFEEIENCCSSKLGRQAAMLSADLITDIMVWVLPIPVVWSLDISIARKLGVLAIFMLGACSLAAAVVRLVIQHQINSGGYAARTNVSLTLSTSLNWFFVESGIGLVACCLPMMRLIGRLNAISSVLSSVRIKLGIFTESLYGEKIHSVGTEDQLDKSSASAIHIEHASEFVSDPRMSNRSRSEDCIV